MKKRQKIVEKASPKKVKLKRDAIPYRLVLLKMLEASYLTDVKGRNNVEIRHA